MKFFILIVFLVTSSYAINFSQMSTQELIVLVGYVKSADSSALKKELKTRVSSMSEKEKKDYQMVLKREREKK